jgi:pimeloyl-ACP methyl ester carboxylesterase
MRDEELGIRAVGHDDPDVRIGLDFAAKPHEQGWNHVRIARAWAELMRKLGYGERWVAQGGDWGSVIVHVLAKLKPEGLHAVHTKEPVSDWTQGVPLSELQDVIRYWRDGYEWRRVEAEINSLPNYRTELDGLGIQLHPRPLSRRGCAPAAVDRLLGHLHLKRSQLAAYSRQWEQQRTTNAVTAHTTGLVRIVHAAASRG